MIDPGLVHRIRVDDGAVLACREWAGPGRQDRLPVLCLSGVTRSSRDFFALAKLLQGQRRLIAPDMRGRGESDRRAPYAPDRLILDLTHILTALGLHRLVVIGTSVGALLGMSLGLTRPTALAGLVLNDIGPEIAPAGLARIAAVAGSPPACPDIEQAEAWCRRVFTAIPADLPDEEWRQVALTTFRQEGDGQWRVDYDPAAIAAVTRPSATNPDLWQVYRSVAAVPQLLVRGAESDLLSLETVQRMREATPALQVVQVPRWGHAPPLHAPPAWGAVQTFLAACDAQA